MNEYHFWEIADKVKRRLFSCLRIKTSKLDYLNYNGYRKKFEAIPTSLIEEWERIKEEYKNNPDADFKRLKGFLYEALFYYACLNRQTIFLDAELAEFGGVEFEESPPWFECIPFYDIIPNLHYIKEEEKKKRKVPQTKADFLITRVDDKGPSPPALIDVKSSKPHADENWGWQITAALRRGFIFQFAYPKTEYPRSLKEWEIKTPCSKCRKISDDYRKCTECGAEIFPFDITSSGYTLRGLLERLGISYEGRF